MPELVICELVKPDHAELFKLELRLMNGNFQDFLISTKSTVIRLMEELESIVGQELTLPLSENYPYLLESGIDPAVVYEYNMYYYSREGTKSRVRLL